MNQEQYIVKHANEAYRSGNYSAAIHLYEQAIERYPQWKQFFEVSINTIKKNKPIFNFKRSYEANVNAVPDRPANFPEWLKLPPLKGVANDYSFIEEAREAWLKNKGKSYTLGVSIVIPVYNRSIEVDFVLAGLVHQTYPKHLMEIVIADDGSQEDISLVYKKYQQYFRIKYCRQDDRGYRLAEARNMGVKNASHDSIIILDSDAIPTEELVENYMQFFHVNRNIAMFGLRHYVSVADLNPSDLEKDKNLIHLVKKIRSENNVTTTITVDGYSIDWRDEHLKKTNNAKQEKLPYRFLVGANCAFTREVFERVGGYSEDFRAWGFEDQEFGYRLLREGTYFIPIKNNYVYHQEPLAGKNDTDRKLGSAITKKIFVDKCPFIYRRNESPRDFYEVPLVSIYIPLFNREQYIVECVQSALAQTVKDLEVVICDDGSTDRSVELINRYFGSNSKVRLIQQKNAGIGAASNTAVRNSKGYYIGQLDADDVLMLDAVEKCLEAMEKNHRLSLVYGTTEYIDQDSKFLSPGWNWPKFTREHMISRMIVHHFRFFRKRDFMRTSGFDETIKNAVDYDMMLKLAEVGEVEHINQVLYQYRRHSEMTTVLHSDEQVLNNFKVINKALERMSITDAYAAPIEKDGKNRGVMFQRKLILSE